MGIPDIYSEKLLKRGIRPTPIRRSIIRTIINIDAVFCMADLETELDTVDRSTIFRSITLFLRRNLIHSFDDGSGALKYALCDDDCDCYAWQSHVHFICTKCNTATCLRNATVPVVKLPDGFSADKINYVVKGKCKRCAGNAT